MTGTKTVSNNAAGVWQAVFFDRPLLRRCSSEALSGQGEGLSQVAWHGFVHGGLPKPRFCWFWSSVSNRLW